MKVFFNLCGPEGGEKGLFPPPLTVAFLEHAPSFSPGAVSPTIIVVTVIYQILGVCVCVYSVMSDSLQPQGPCQTPLPMEFSRQEYWSRLSFPFPGKVWVDEFIP